MDERKIMAPKLWIETAPLTRFSESIRSLREALFSQFQPNEKPVLVMSAPHKGDGCSTVTANLAASCAHAGKKTLIIDGDIAGKGLDEIIGSSAKAGLLEYITGAQKAGISSVFERLDFLPAGSTTQGGHPFDSPRLKDIIEEFRRNYDIIFFDTPPVLNTSDAVVLGQKSTGLILVFRAGSFLREDELTTRELLDRSGVRIIGAIVNRSREEDNDPYYTYQRLLEKKEK